MSERTKSNKPLLLLNIGNTRTQIALWRGEKMRVLDTPGTESWLDAGAPMPDGIAAHETLQCFAACVVPRARVILRQQFEADQLSFMDANLAGGMLDFSQVDPHTIGADRIANAAAVVALGLIPAVIVDCGTAVTLEVIDAEGRFLGGAILPGRALQRRALHRHTGQLPEVAMAQDLIVPPGRDTASAIRFGVDNGLLGTVEHLIGESLLALADEDGDGENNAPPVNVLCTGGDAEFFCRHVPILRHAPENLTLRGLAAIAGGLV